MVSTTSIKAKPAYKVPSSTNTIEILQYKKQTSSPDNFLIFVTRKGKPYSDIVLTKLIRDQQIESNSPNKIATAHEFRSTLRNWATENAYPKDITELALSLTIKTLRKRHTT